MANRYYGLAVLAALVVATWFILTSTSQTTSGTVSITVSGYIAATPVDPQSSITIDPASVKTVSFNSIPSWINTNAADDMIFNMSGTNVNLTIAYEYAVKLPPSYPQNLEPPVIAPFMAITGSSSTLTLSGTPQVVTKNYTIDVDLLATNVQNLYANGDLEQTDIPEGFLNTFYGLSYNETEWYPYLYEATITIPGLSVLYDTSTGQFVVADQTTLCLLIADPDNSLASSQLSGDEIILVNPTCQFDSDGINTTGAQTAPSRADLVSTADYVAPSGVSPLSDKPATAFYSYNQTDFVVLNFTVSYPNGATGKAYFKAEVALDGTTLKITLIPVLPVPYSAVLGPLYEQQQQPYLHAWPLAILPVGAPAGSYSATIYLTLEQT